MIYHADKGHEGLFSHAPLCLALLIDRDCSLALAKRLIGKLCAACALGNGDCLARVGSVGKDAGRHTVAVTFNNRIFLRTEHGLADLLHKQGFKRRKRHSSDFFRVTDFAAQLVVRKHDCSAKRFLLRIRGRALTARGAGRCAGIAANPSRSRLHAVNRDRLTDRVRGLSDEIVNHAELLVLLQNLVYKVLWNHGRHVGVRGFCGLIGASFHLASCKVFLKRLAVFKAGCALVFLCCRACLHGGNGIQLTAFAAVRFGRLCGLIKLRKLLLTFRDLVTQRGKRNANRPHFRNVIGSVRTLLRLFKLLTLTRNQLFKKLFHVKSSLNQDVFVFCFRKRKLIRCLQAVRLLAAPCIHKFAASCVY